MFAIFSSSALHFLSNPYFKPHILCTLHILLVFGHISLLHGECSATDSPFSVHQFKRYDDIVAFSAFDTILKANESIQQLLLNSL